MTNLFEHARKVREYRTENSVYVVLKIKDGTETTVLFQPSLKVSKPKQYCVIPNIRTGIDMDCKLTAKSLEMAKRQWLKSHFIE